LQLKAKSVKEPD
jgi:addiction module HigA family antidote